mmetsp:Transcript_4711/g.9613  ORF Transcript_4711/g.9613 Transcript_4711/m.9613 type:complete len:437 (+) Transcript_4711:628-1938(+)
MGTPRQPDLPPDALPLRPPPLLLRRRTRRSLSTGRGRRRRRRRGQNLPRQKPRRRRRRSPLVSRGHRVRRPRRLRRRLRLFGLRGGVAGRRRDERDEGRGVVGVGGGVVGASPGALGSLEGTVDSSRFRRGNERRQGSQRKIRPLQPQRSPIPLPRLLFLVSRPHLLPAPPPLRTRLPNLLRALPPLLRRTSILHRTLPRTLLLFRKRSRLRILRRRPLQLLLRLRVLRERRAGFSNEQRRRRDQKGVRGHEHSLRGDEEFEGRGVECRRCQVVDGDVQRGERRDVGRDSGLQCLLRASFVLLWRKLRRKLSEGSSRGVSGVRGVQDFGSRSRRRGWRRGRRNDRRGQSRPRRHSNRREIRMPSGRNDPSRQRRVGGAMSFRLRQSPVLLFRRWDEEQLSGRLRERGLRCLFGLWGFVFGDGGFAVCLSERCWGCR